MFKIIGIAFIGLISYLLIKNTKPDIAPLLLISVGATMLILLSDTIVNVINVFTNLSSQAGLPENILSSLLKIIGIGYLTEYASELCKDSDCSSLGKKIELAGKLVILVSTLPIITSVIHTIEDLL